MMTSLNPVTSEKCQERPFAIPKSEACWSAQGSLYKQKSSGSGKRAGCGRVSHRGKCGPKLIGYPSKTCRTMFLGEILAQDQQAREHLHDVTFGNW
jgi:hypothetical protein